jgi:hypothetical protein
VAAWQMRPASRVPKVPVVTDMDNETDIRRAPGMRVLVAFEDVRRLYRDVFARALRELRPAHTVRSASLVEIERVLGRFDPHVVVCSQPNGTDPPRQRCVGAHPHRRRAGRRGAARGDLPGGGPVEDGRAAPVGAARGHRRNLRAAAPGKPIGLLLKIGNSLSGPLGFRPRLSGDSPH